MDASFTKVIVDGGVNWIKLKPGMDKAAVFLETHRCANLKSGSIGFTKLESTTVNAKEKIAYSALQNIQSSMMRGNAAWRDSTNIAADKAFSAGGVFAHNPAGGQRDLDGTAMSSDWVPVQTKTLLKGEDIAEDALGNVANPEKVSNPDNLELSEKLHALHRRAVPTSTIFCGRKTWIFRR